MAATFTPAFAALVAQRDAQAERARGFRDMADNYGGRGWEIVAQKAAERAAEAQAQANALSVALRTIALRGRPGRAPIPLFGGRA